MHKTLRNEAESDRAQFYDLLSQRDDFSFTCRLNISLLQLSQLELVNFLCFCVLFHWFSSVRSFVIIKLIFIMDRASLSLSDLSFMSFACLMSLSARRISSDSSKLLADHQQQRAEQNQIHPRTVLSIKRNLSCFLFPIPFHLSSKVNYEMSEAIFEEAGRVKLIEFIKIKQRERNWVFFGARVLRESHLAGVTCVRNFSIHSINESVSRFLNELSRDDVVALPQSQHNFSMYVISYFFSFPILLFITRRRRRCDIWIGTLSNVQKNQIKVGERKLPLKSGQVSSCHWNEINDLVIYFSLSEKF